MTADALGNDLELASIIRTGFIALNSSSGEITPPTEEELLQDTLPTGYKFVGLLTSDGGYAEEQSAGDTTNFYQAGYSIQTGEEELTGSFTMAEENAVRANIMGFVKNVRKKIVNDTPKGAIIRVGFRNGLTKTYGGIIQVTEVTENQNETGALSTLEVKFKWQFSTAYCGYYLRVTKQDTTGGC